MAKLAIAVATQASTVPAGPAFAGILISLLASSGTVFGTQTASTAPYQVDFDNVPDDNYTVTAQSVDANGTAIGSPVTSTQFTVATAAAAPAQAPAPAVMTVDTPISITVTQS